MRFASNFERSLKRCLRRKMLLDGVTLFTLVFFVDQINSLAVQGDEIFILSNKDQLNISSPGFPGNCCHGYTARIQYLQRFRLMFTDLDLPPGSSLTIRDQLSDRLLAVQPELLSSGVWKRPVIEGGNSFGEIVISFSPAPQWNGDYVGFRAVVWTTTDKPGSRWHNQPFTEGCPVLASAMEGKSLALKPRYHPIFTDKVYHCVWQLKVPPQLQASVYIRILSLHMDGSLHIRNGISSDGDRTSDALYLKWNSYHDYSWNGRLFESETGLYVYVIMPTQAENNYFKFVYGILVHMQNDHCPPNTSYIKWFPCQLSNVCIPWQHRCNQYPNCPHGEDESIDTCASPSPPPTPAPSLSPSSLIFSSPAASRSDSCAKNFRRCADGSCRYHTRPCDGQCPPGMNKLCADGSCLFASYLCPEDSCSQWQPNRCQDNSGCYGDADKCDATAICRNGEDERNCAHYLGHLITMRPTHRSSIKSRGRNRLLYVVATPLIIIIGIICIIYYCFGAHKQRGRPNNANAIGMQPVRGSRSHCSQSQYSPRPGLVSEPVDHHSSDASLNRIFEDIPRMSPVLSRRSEEDSSLPFSSPPPPYEEVARIPPQDPNFILPPSYESVTESNSRYV
ncbi:hypothetical protein CAPTEDRAFT_226924 [Capitella teleta]|uniref:Uncharacterized protein n=1 Tax=Capitella teleta TaxID=283909 RepID=R7U1W5_CAPTE|nr:hypothetical protein CAPTEDRAFT_226924 [Capitella teleta]|eukprot:ELT99837.1 hypothetical protein CAPTEDRAFT_226924 [Capitella teleta]